MHDVHCFGATPGSESNQADLPLTLRSKAAARAVPPCVATVRPRSIATTVTSGTASNASRVDVPAGSCALTAALTRMLSAIEPASQVEVHVGVSPDPAVGVQKHDVDPELISQHYPGRQAQRSTESQLGPKQATGRR